MLGMLCKCLQHNTFTASARILTRSSEEFSAGLCRARAPIAVHAATAAGTVWPDTPDSLEPSVSYTAPMPSRANVDPVGQNS